MKVSVLAGIGIIIAGIGLRFYQNMKEQQRWQPPERQKVKAFLLKMRQQMYPCLLEVCRMIQLQLKQLNGIQISPEIIEQLKKYILSPQCPTGLKIDKILKQMHQQISEEDLHRALEQSYINDPEIQYHRKAFQEEFHKAFLGVQPSLKTEMPTYITPQKILIITKKLLSQKILRLRNVSQQGQQITQQFLNNDYIVDAKIRTQQLKNLGLRQVKNPSEILQFCCAKYLQMDTEFATAYKKLVEDYRKQAQQILCLN